MDHARTRLLIVYNADSGVMNALLHALHKQFAPATYPCSLCALTYGSVSMRREWRAFLNELPLEVVFHHRDDFAAAYPGHGYDLPAILLADKDSAPRILVPAAELNPMAELSDLIVRVESQLEIERTLKPRVRARA
ncbi:hypothetical protein FGU71_08145 [Erythrobacter insulae]|uniref:GTPase n=1 Tax=Erythrobacter insulae TaxID=2584124 RepID=A0A547PCF7_9SPHN|nr:hypothetical protein [Erythrobacter insulae]TRD11828.1 hypothetical protein FGU71_08145 [Erythrobacter insulae]